MKRVITILLILFIFASPCSVWADNNTAVETASPPELVSEAAILIEQNSGKVLFEKNADKKMFPASTTKNMVALLALENLQLDEVVKVGEEIKLISWDASKAGLEIGDRITVEELIWAILLRSGSDAVHTVAVQVARKASGNTSMEAKEAIKYFVDMMNERAVRLGAKNTHFITPDGYQHPDHYSTAYDLAIIAREAMSHDFFRNVVKAPSYEKKDTHSQETMLWPNRNELVNPQGKYYYPYATGIKTGHTSNAGYCLISSAEKDGLSVISVTLNSLEDEGRWTDAKKILEYALENFEVHTVVAQGQAVANIDVVKHFMSKPEALDAVAEGEFFDTFLKTDIPNITYDISWDEKLIYKEEENGEIYLKGPVSKGQALGTVNCMVNGNTLYQCKVVAGQDTASVGILDRAAMLLESITRHPLLYGIPFGMVVLLLLVLWAKARHNRKNRNRYTPKYRM